MKSEMKEQFDKRLVEKIKGSFENYEEPFDPKEWDKFSSAYFNKKKPNPIWIWTSIISGIAASLVLAFLIWPAVEDSAQEEYISYDREQPVTGEVIPDKEESITPDIQENIGKTDVLNKSAGLDTDVKTVSPDYNETILNDISNTSYASAKVAKEMKEVVDVSRTIAAQVESLDMIKFTPLKKLEMAEAYDREVEPEIIQHSPSLQLNVAASKEPLKEEEAQKIINTWAMADSPVQKEGKVGDGGVKWGLVMAPQAASNTTMGLNLGGGVMSEISLTKRLKLDVGVTFARQSIVPGQGQNVAMVMNRTPGNASADQLQNTPAFSTNRASLFMGANAITPVSPTYELTFANLDIPINLKYKVMENSQSGLYLISGLSSMIYLSQSTSETYNISYVGIAQANAFSSNQVQTLTTEVTPVDGENSVDLGRMLNLSFGYEYKLTNGTFLSVEPFYKLPIGNMTFVDQQFSIGGVNLRMNFQFKK